MIKFKHCLILCFISFFANQSWAQKTLFNDMTPEKWKEDLDYLVKKTEKTFALFSDKNPKEDFVKKAKEIEQNLDEYNNIESAIALNKLLASLKDGHTELSLFQSEIDLKKIPLILYYHQNDLFIVGAEKKHEQYIGSKIKKIGNSEIKNVYDKITTLLAHDNEMEFLLEVPRYVCSPEILHYLGIIPNNEIVEIEIEDKYGNISNISLKGMNSDELNAIKLIKARDGNNQALYLSNTTNNYWFKQIPDTKILYLKLSRIDDQKGEAKLKNFIKDAFNLYDNNKLEYLIVDLRYNRGGNYDKVEGLFDEIQDRPNLQNDKKLYVITDRVTFSAAVVTAAKLKHNYSATIVGEKARGNPHTVDNYEPYELPNSGLEFGVTDRLKDHLPNGSKDPFVPVDIPVETTFKEYDNNIDAVLNKLLLHIKNQ